MSENRKNEWTDTVRETVQKSLDVLSPAAVSFLREFLETAETVYIDALAGASAWSLYLARLWKRTLEREEPETSCFNTGLPCILVSLRG